MMPSNFEAEGQAQGQQAQAQAPSQGQAQGQGPSGAASEALPKWQEAGESSEHREQILHYHTMSCPQFARGECTRMSCFCYHATAEKRRPLVDSLLGRLRYWDKMCECVEQGQQCPYGDACTFAHTKEEMMYHAANYKTKLCTLEGCSDKSCPFAHGPAELRSWAHQRYSYWVLAGGSSYGIEGASWIPDMSAYDPAIVAAAGPNPVDQAAAVEAFNLNYAQEQQCQVDRMGHMNGAYCMPQVYKHRFCASYPNVSSCRRGDACAFAHTREDIRLPLLTEDEEEQKPAALTNDFFMYRFKTLWCPVGVQHDWQTCVYAHNYQDARRHPRVGYGPRPCPYWKRQETSLEYSQRCPLGVRCPFSHGAKEQLYHPSYFKTVTCQDSPSGACPRGKLCAFWHKRSQQRARPSKNGLHEEFNYKLPIQEPKMQEHLQPDFLTPPFKLLNAMQANMQAMAMGMHQDMMQSEYHQMQDGMQDGMQGWMPQMCGYGDVGTPVTQTTGIDSDEAASSLSGSDKQGATGSGDAGQQTGAAGGMGDASVAPWGACGGQPWACGQPWNMEGQCMVMQGCGGPMSFGACPPCGGGQMMCYMVPMPQQEAGCGVQMPSMGALPAPQHPPQEGAQQDTSSADLLLAELGSGQSPQGKSGGGEVTGGWANAQGDNSPAQMTFPGIYMMMPPGGSNGTAATDYGSFPQ